MLKYILKSLFRYLWGANYQSTHSKMALFPLLSCIPKSLENSSLTYLPLALLKGYFIRFSWKWNTYCQPANAFLQINFFPSFWNWTHVSCIAGRFFTSWATGKPKNTGVGSLFLLQQIFPTQETNQVLLPCRWIFINWAIRKAHWITLKEKFPSVLKWQWFRFINY